MVISLTKEESENFSAVPVGVLMMLFDLCLIRFEVEDGKITGIEV